MQRALSPWEGLSNFERATSSVHWKKYPRFLNKFRASTVIFFLNTVFKRYFKVIIMNKIYNSIGTMSGTSFDGVDVSLIKTDGQDILEVKINLYEKFNEQIKSNLSSKYFCLQA